MKSLKNFVERFESKKPSGLTIEKEKIKEERIISYADLGHLENYILEKDKGFGERSVVKNLGDKGDGRVIGSAKEIEPIYFKSPIFAESFGDGYFIRVSFNNAIPFHEDLTNLFNLDKNVVSLDMGIYKKDLEVSDSNKIDNIFNLHYGVYDGKVVSKDVHHNKNLITVNEESLDGFVEFVGRSIYNGEFRSSLTSSSLSGDIYKIGFREEELYKSLMSQEEINSKLIFPNLKKRDISNPYQGMDLFFDIVDKIKEKTR